MLEVKENGGVCAISLAIPEGGMCVISEGFGAFISPIMQLGNYLLLIHKSFVNLATVVMLLTMFTKYLESLSCITLISIGVFVLNRLSRVLVLGHHLY